MTRSVLGQTFLFRYGIAIASVAAATLLSRVLSGLGDSGISPQFFGAILLSAWYGGYGPGLLATMLSGVAAAGLLIAPDASAATIRDDVFRVTVFTVVALITSSFHAASRRAKHAAESASLAKSRFLAAISHELLTPLSPILIATEFLLDDPSIPPQMTKDLETIRRNLDLEIRLVNDLLDLSRIDAGKLRMRFDQVDIHQLLRETVALCEGDIRDREQSLRLTLGAAHSLIAGDSLRLQQVFWNLLRNASKFTSHGGSISISTRDQDSQIEIEISDNGVGIDAPHLKSIFNAFEQVGGDEQTGYGGLGLGLAISRSLTLAHGGMIAASSRGVGEGATFTVVLPHHGRPEKLESWELYRPSLS